MPSVSIGMNDVRAPALLADSGPAMLSTAPLPNCSGVFESFFQRVGRKRRQDRTPPGRMPSTEPITVPRQIGPRIRFHS